MRLKYIARCVGISLANAGLNLGCLYRAMLGLPFFFRNAYKVFGSDRRGWRLSLFPMLADRFAQSGLASGHYFLMDLWAARLVYRLHPKTIIDVGSRVDGFVAHVLSFSELQVFDVRPLLSNVQGLRFHQINMAIKQDISASAECVSCLHALEHFGLGRYGDLVDLDAWLVGFENLIKLLLPGGILILALPVGSERIEFDAHRIFNPVRILNLGIDFGLSLKSFSLIDDSGCFYENVDVNMASNMEYACGCFEFVLGALRLNNSDDAVVRNK